MGASSDVRFLCERFEQLCFFFIFFLAFNFFSISDSLFD